MKITQTAIELIKPYTKNAKKHPEDQVEKIKRSIEEFGFNQPIVVDKDNVVIVGHGRLMAAMQLGLKTVPVLTVNLTEEQAKAYRLADNKLNESDWDMDLVLEELKELEVKDFDVTLTGFDLNALEGTQEVVEDDYDVEPPTDPKSEYGQLYALGGCVDCPHCGVENELGKVDVR